MPEIWRIEKLDGSGPDSWHFDGDEKFPSREAAAEHLWRVNGSFRDNPHKWRIVQVPE